MTFPRKSLSPKTSEHALNSPSGACSNGAGSTAGPEAPPYRRKVGRGVPDAPGTVSKSESESGQTTETTGHFAHRVGLQLAGGFLRFAHPGEHEVLEHLDIIRVNHIG